MASFYDTFLSIMIERVNLDGRCDDAEVCKDIAAWLNMQEFPCHYGHDLFEFIYDYGEDTDDTYMGRDEEGEKVYHTFNPTTNWHYRISEELKALGFFKRYDTWAEAQKAKEGWRLSA